METLSRLLAGELTGLTRLTLREGLIDFPCEIFGLADSLEILDLSGNRLSELPEDLDRLAKLRILFCSENNFTHLPAVLGKCPALEMVAFKANRIKTVDEAALSPKLRWLILTDNRIEKLPTSIGRCVSLQKLMLAGNRLEELPVEMANCRNLELIRLSANCFQSFPAWLFELPRLSWLAVAGNPAEAVSSGEPIREIPWMELQLEHQLGEGASGVIHRALWKPEDKAVAVKLFKGGMTSDGLPEREMNACVAAGNHPNLIGVFGKVHGHPSGSLGLVMPLIDPYFVNLADPPDLETCTRDRYPTGLTLTPTKLMKKLRALVSAARHLHAKGIAHGDFYAHNILWNDDGECLLGDFGAASFYSRDMAMERIEVRAFGCLVEELLACCHLRTGDDQNFANLRNLTDKCLAEEVRSRPDFAEIEKFLTSLQFQKTP